MLAASEQKGQTVGVDFSIGMAIFVLTVATALFYTNTVILPSSPFSGQVQRSAQQGAEALFEAADWQVTATPVSLDTTTATTYPVTVPFLLPPQADPASLLVMHGGQEVASQHSTARNETVFIAELPSQREYRIVYTEETSLPDRSYTDTVSHSGDTIRNSNMNLTFDAAGIDSLLFQTTETLIRDTDLGVPDSGTAYRDGPVRATAVYRNSGERLELAAFGRTNRIRLSHNVSSSRLYRFNLSSSFDWLYTGSGTTSLSGSGEQFQGTTDVLDLTYNDTTPTYGLALVGQQMDVRVERPSSGGQVLVNVTLDGSGRRLLVLPHTGDHTNVTGEQQLFLQPPERVLATQTRNGLSERTLQNLAGMTADELRSQLGLTQLGFNISVGSVFDAGEPIPDAQEVAARQYPAPVLSRFGNTTLHQFRMAVWLE